ncbi:hypothetical protein ORV05_23705 [Amycolatopsis cynarae]|uniref:DUF7660 domain-containing protein n=1 Tax=Amycolatopsis cynarae TaxID=2995223 RepID=A0ABY7AXR2_9PSEU|nr:hypothetical protein [Amycolatopsis sp. HUAS 11-8]WAL63984.1 hypothetical protein ORV05_23705 [Amycolatopsis sp. HUAS 11-8]
MDKDEADLLCRECSQPVANRESYSRFDGMHFVCFHYAFEHWSVDRDDDCGLDGCPSASQDRGRDHLLAVLRALVDDWSDGPPANWDIRDLPDYLEALADWLAGADSDRAELKARVPMNSWAALAAGWKAATVYE